MQSCIIEMNPIFNWVCFNKIAVAAIVFMRGARPTWGLQANNNLKIHAG